MALGKLGGHRWCRPPTREILAHDTGESDARVSADELSGATRLVWRHANRPRLPAVVEQNRPRSDPQANTIPLATKRNATPQIQVYGVAFRACRPPGG